MLETIGIFAAKTIASYASKKGLDSFFDKIKIRDFERRLSKVIDDTITEFKEKNPISETDGKFAFYDSQIIVNELLKFRFFSSDGYQFGEKSISSELSKNPNVILPDNNQIKDFLELFDQHVQSDEKLRELEIDDSYKSEIFSISDKIDKIDSMLRELLSGRTGKPKELTDMVSIPKKDIVGREDDLKNLRNSLLKENVTALINGMGGIGKTTLAAVYISEFYDDYDHIAWLTLENTLEEAVAANASLLKNLDLRDVHPQEQLSACLNALRTLESEKPKLLILDNAHENLAEHYDKLPKAHGWHLLVTSRERIPRFHIMDLDFLTEDEAIELFEKHNSRFSVEQARSIVNQVELHTLTIELLAKSSQKNRWDLNKVQNALKLDAKAGVRVPHHKDKIERIKSYLTSIFDISDLSEHETYLLKQFTALPNQWIKYDFLSELLQRDALEWKEDFAGTLSDVCNKGYVLEDEKAESYKMHPVLVEALAPHLNTTTEDVMLLVKSVSELLRLDQAKDNPIDKFQYIPFGDAILKQIPDDSSAETSLLKNNLASAYEDRGEYEKARDLLEQALESDLENFGDKHPNVAASQSNLANVYSGLGEYEKARDLLEQALESDLENFDDKHSRVAAHQSNLATVYRNLGEYEKARDLLEQALASDLENFGDKHPDVAVDQSNLGNVYRNLGDNGKARDLLEQALASARENFGDKHPTVAIRQSNLAHVYVRMGDYEKARDLWMKAYDIFVAALGEQHPHAKAVKGFLDSIGTR